MRPVPANARRLPIATLAASSAGFRTRQAIERAIREKRLVGLSQQIQDELADRLLSLNGKHPSPRVIVRRLEENWDQVKDKALKRHPSLDAYALDVAKPVVQQLVVDTESLFASLKSLVDVAARLVGTTERRVLHIPQSDRTTHDQLIALGTDPNRRETLTGIRDQLIHESVPWFEVVIPPNSTPDLLIGYSPKPDYAAGTGFILLSELDSLVRSVDEHLDAVETMLVNRIDQHQKPGGVGVVAP